MNSDTLWVDRGFKPAMRQMLDEWNGEKYDILLLLHPMEQIFGDNGRGIGNYRLDGQGGRSVTLIRKKVFPIGLRAFQSYIRAFLPTARTANFRCAICLTRRKRTAGSALSSTRAFCFTSAFPRLFGRRRKSCWLSLVEKFILNKCRNRKKMLTVAQKCYYLRVSE